MFYDAFSEGPVDIPGVHDKDSIRTFAILFKPDVWTANTVYTRPYPDEYAVVIPTVFTGLYYKCNNPGKAGSVEPTWIMSEGEETTDGTLGLIWEAVNYNLMPVDEDVYSITYEMTNGVTLSNESNTIYAAQFTIDVLPTAAITAGEFEITAHVVKSTGNKFDVTLRFTVGTR